MAETIQNTDNLLDLTKITDLLNHEFYIMKFDAEGNPDWTVPTVEPKE